MKAGIWQGRFQYVHNGHYYIFKNELPKFEKKIVAIVNPNPHYPACNNFSRFNDNRNPFSYFQRMLLWKAIADYEKMAVIFVPCWHARYKIALENDFLPAANKRYWIIPIAQDDAEEDKANDLKSKGENIHDADFEKETAEFARISASMIRSNISSGNNNYKKYIPECIHALTENLFKGIDTNVYFMIPFIDDKIDIYSIQYSIDAVQKSNQNSYILFTIMVHVTEGEKEWKTEHAQPWWFKQARHPNGVKTYYKKAKLIEELMNEISCTKYLITPIFVMNNDVDILSDYNIAFLPSFENVKIIINECFDDYEKYNFMSWLDNSDAEENIIYIPSEIKINENLQKFFLKKDNFIMKSKDDSMYKSLSEVLIKNSQDEISKIIDSKILDIQRDIDNGGLTIDEKERLTNLINIIYPKIKIEYLSKLNLLNQNNKKHNSEKGVNELRKKIADISNNFKATIKDIED